jgi:cyclophilin family peptidyl-prolyl cis-trans isomerase
VIVIELDGDAAPWHVATFANLANKGFYDTLLFHRVVPDFVVQGGDPTGTGWGGPGFTLPAEPSNARYDRGVVGVADAGKDTGGSQWFAMHSRAPHLEGRYTVIGRIVEGEEHVDELLVGDRIVKSSVVVQRE